MSKQNSSNDPKSSSIEKKSSNEPTNSLNEQKIVLMSKKRKFK